jgi:hypothetical protein
MRTASKIRIAALSLAVAAGLGARPASGAMFADGPATVPATQGAPQQGTSLQVTVAEVHGSVQVREDEKQPWKAAKEGMVVNEGAEFRTGPRSSVRCTIPPDQSFTLDRLGTVKVLQAIKDGSKLHTDMLMKYGRTKYSVEAAGLTHEGTISSPSGTLAVRGTVTSLYDQPPFVPEAVSYTGVVAFRDAHRQINVGSKGGGTQVVAGDQDSAAETALNHGTTDPKVAGARTGSEQAVLATEVSRGAVAQFNPQTTLTTVSGGTPISNDAQLAASLPGKLNFVARWFGPANIDLEVSVEFGNPTDILFGTKTFEATEILLPQVGLNRSQSGGVIPYDHIGGPNGGTEVAFWTNPPKEAVYGITGNFISGNKAVEVKLNVFLDKQKQSLFYIDEQGNFIHTKTIDVMLGPGTAFGSFLGGLVFIPPVDALEQIPITGDDGTGSGSTSGTTTTTSAQVKPAKKTNTKVVSGGRGAGTPTAAAVAKPAAKPAAGAATAGNRIK